MKAGVTLESSSGSGTEAGCQGLAKARPVPLFATLFVGGMILLAGAGCSKPDYNKELPDSTSLGNPRGHRIARVITHFHSPYSYDACDKAGLQEGGVPNPTCLGHLRYALCASHVDLTFVSDHPDHMSSNEFAQLLIPGDGDTLQMKAGAPYYNEMAACGDGFRPKLLTGFEGGKIMALGMTNHLAGDVAARAGLYGGDTAVFTQRLKDESDAFVVIPHTESKAVDWIRTVAPHAIEIYNYHANLDPKIRQKDLGLAPFGKTGWLLTYILDPYKDLTPDLAFVHMLEISPIYAQKWRELILGGLKVVGILGTDSHENLLPQSASDGERVDSHRRLTRMMSNHVIADSTEPDAIKAALKAGHSWAVFEGFGTPVDMDFSASVGATTIGVGDSISLAGQTAVIRVDLPMLHKSSPRGQEAPSFVVRLKHLLPDRDEVVAVTRDMPLAYPVSSAGVYRAEIAIIPLHLKEYLEDFPSVANQEYPWILTNPIYLE